MGQEFCQSCGMPLTDTNKGTNSDGSLSNEYCSYCYQEGQFTQDFNMNQMIEFCVLLKDEVAINAFSRLYKKSFFKHLMTVSFSSDDKSSLLITFFLHFD